MVLRRKASAPRLPPGGTQHNETQLHLQHITLLFDVMAAVEALRMLHDGEGGRLNHESDLDDALDALRMAMTNLPFNRQRVEACWKRLRPHLRNADSHVLLDNRMRAAIEEDSSQGGLSGSAPTVVPADASTIPAYKLKSCYVQQEMHNILPGLFIGSYHPAASRALLDAQGITHVCCCINVSPRFPEVYSYLVLPADDNASYDISQFFESSFRFIDNALSRGGNVLVHCGAGISRAPTIAAAYMIRKLGIDADHAIRLIKSVRSCASPNRGFVELLRQLSSSHISR